MSQILNLLNNLQSTSSRLGKEAILRAELDNELFKHVIQLALDPHVQFYIRKIPTYETLSGRMDARIDLNTALNMLSNLSERTVTGNAAIEYLSVVLARLSADDAKVLERVIEKDLKCGVSDSTVNKIWPGFIPSYPVMLASAFDQKLVDKVSFPAYVQLKMDGMRFNAIVKNGVVSFRSRNGKSIDIPSELFPLPFVKMAESLHQDVVFDGELLVVDITGKPRDRKTGNGILNKAVKGTMSEEESQDVRATLWDIIPLEEFNKGEYRQPYSERIGMLNKCLSHLVKNHFQLAHLARFVEHVEVNSLSQAQSRFESYLDQGEEGIILKTKDAIWEDKRSKGSIKFKGEFECDLKIVGWVEGTGKNVGRLGALLCETEDGLLQCGLGTGFTDNDRDIIGQDVVGKIVAVKYNAKIVDKKTGIYSLFLPVFIEIRDDKTVADNLEDLK